MDRLKKNASKEYPVKVRIPVALLGFFLFLAVFPTLFFWGGNLLDGWFKLPRGFTGAFFLPIGIVMVISGLILAVWSAYYHFFPGKGTQVPLMPGHKLLWCGPYRFCRNPMVLGMALAYTGLAFLLHSWGVMMINLGFQILNLLYLKLIEEKELEARYGDAYSQYKRATPFFWFRFSAPVNKKTAD